MTAVVCPLEMLRSSLFQYFLDTRSSGNPLGWYAICIRSRFIGFLFLTCVCNWSLALRRGSGGDEGEEVDEGRFDEVQKRRRGQGQGTQVETGDRDRARRRRRDI
jgi:hypothetical protein